MSDMRSRGEICKDVREFLASAKEFPLSPEEEMKLRGHLEGCEDCRRLRDAGGWEWDLLAKASLPSPRSSDSEFLAATHRRVRRRSALRMVGALAAAALLAALGLSWYLPARDDQAVIENLAVLEDLQDMPIDLLSFLSDESKPTPRGELDD